MSDPLESKTTAEEISAYAEQIVQEVAAERAGDKSDATIVAEQSSTKPPAVTQSGKPSAEVPGDDSDDSTTDNGEDSEEADSGPEWLTDDVKAEAAAYGIDESEIADFSSREELDRALRLFDKSALEAGRKALADGDGKTRNEKGQFEKKEPKTDDQPRAGSSYEVSLDKDLYDEAVINEFTKIHDHLRDQYEARFEALESRFQDVSAKSEEQRFDNLVDSLDLPDLFGKTGHESDKELERRKDLLVALKAQMIGLQQLNRPADMSQSLISRVARMVYADELAKKDLKQRTRKLSKQSSLRQGGSATRPQDPRENPRDEADRLYRELAGQQ